MAGELDKPSTPGPRWRAATELTTMVAIGALALSGLSFYRSYVYEKQQLDITVTEVSYVTNQGEKTLYLMAGQVVLGGELHHCIEIERVAQRVGQHDGPGPVGTRHFELGYFDVVCRNLYVDKHRNESVLNDGIDGGGKSRRHGDDFIARH